MTPCIRLIGVLSAFAFIATGNLTAQPAPEVDVHFRKVVLDAKTADPMELAVTPDGRVIFLERGGSVKIWKPDTQSTVIAAQLPASYNPNGAKGVSWEDGILGIALDPDFAANRWLYVYHSPTNVSENQISRFELKGDTLALDTEKIVLRVPVERDVCCHSGGSMTFDGQGNLFLSTGDNTNPFESDGFAPIDYRPGRRGWDAARTAGNTADLRGKILRIHPEKDGSYTIPKGNLFPPGTPKTRPEIFVMGDRNPFRISVDKPSGTLYWGEVGPDAQTAKEDRGPAGFDEFNRTKKAGNFGWPFVIADNKAYLARDFAANIMGEPFAASAPKNLSPNNTGLTDLPPAQPAWIWYPYAPSSRFPTLGSGARTACAGPTYHFDASLRSEHKLPKEFDNTLFLFEWARHTLFAVKLDEKGEIANIRPFVQNLKFKHPVEMEIGPDGCIYMIEFGTNWEKNTDSQVIKLEYVEVLKS